MEESKDCYVDVDVDVGGEEKGGKYSEKENIFFLEENKNREGIGRKYISRRSLQKLSRILRSLGLGLGLPKIAIFSPRFSFFPR